MRLLLDLGNTRLKWALQGQHPTWLAHGAVEWADLDDGLAATWKDLPRPSSVVAASVADADRKSVV